MGRMGRRTYGKNILLYFLLRTGFPGSFESIRLLIEDRREVVTIIIPSSLFSTNMAPPRSLPWCPPPP